jgi:hypothetical protein
MKVFRPRIFHSTPKTIKFKSKTSPEKPTDDLS